MKATHSRQKSYADRRCKPLELEVGDQVFFRVSSTKSITRLGMAGKLSPRYVGPYPVVQRIGTSWNYHQNCQGCIMSSMHHNYTSTSLTPPMSLCWILYSYEKTCRMKSTQFASWIKDKNNSVRRQCH